MTTATIIGAPRVKVLKWARHAGEASLLAAVAFYFFSPEPSTLRDAAATTPLFWAVLFVVGLACLWWSHRARGSSG